MAKSRKAYFGNLKASFLLLMMVSGFLCYGCGGNGGGDPASGLDEFFLNGVATAEATHLPAYWLGRGFTVENLTFYGPYGADTTEGEQITTNYIAPIGENANVIEGPSTVLELTTYSQAAWGPASARLMNSKSPGVTRQSVTVGDHKATVVVETGLRTPVNAAVSLVVELDSVVVVADVHSSEPAAPGGLDYDPFINNPDLLVQVMQNLRPYPQ